MPTTVNTHEIDQFQKDSAAWWDETGPFAPLHALNPVRMEFMVGVMDEQRRSSAHAGDPVPPTSRDPRTKSEGPESWTHLDIGCGGGLVAEPFARLGAAVTGLDADAQAIAVAAQHAAAMGLVIDYQACPVEDFRMQYPKTKFDTVTALEIIEHVDHPDVFLDELVACVKPGGLMFLSTLNRTAKSFALGVVAAEYILGWVPKGTHDWRKFIKPSQLSRLMADRGCTAVAASGIAYNPLKRDFYLAPHDLDVNYIMAFVKNEKPGKMKP